MVFRARRLPNSVAIDNLCRTRRNIYKRYRKRQASSNIYQHYDESVTDGRCKFYGAATPAEAFVEFIFKNVDKDACDWHLASE